MDKGIRAITVLGFFVMAAFAAPAMAQYSDSAWYVGGHLTHADFTEANDSDTGWGALFGYEFTPNYALEAGYVDFGTISDSVPGFSVSLGAKAIELAGIGAFEMSERVSMFGRFGFYRADTKLDVNIIDIDPINDRDTGTGISYGIGVSARFGNNLALRGSWQRYDDVGDLMDVDALSVAILFRF